jgi:NAD(P)-dependent dehydrogenase (short-subunit alcohol dehydrogenase family)
MSASNLKNVLIVGATGNIGRAISEGFLSNKSFQTFLLSRKGAEEVRSYFLVVSSPSFALCLAPTLSFAH